jgi:transcription elongation GreA/GreB family factor
MAHGAVSSLQSIAHGRAAGSEVFEALKSRLADRLERLSAELLALRGQSSPADAGAAVTAEADATHRAIEARMRLLGQLASGLAEVVPAALPVDGVGYGSTVALEDLEEGGQEEYTLVTGQLIDPDAGQVSLASPVGQALLGRCIGDTVEIRTPQKLRRVRITALRTIHERLGLNGRPRREA